MHLRQLLQPSADWLNAPTPGQVARVALTTVAGLALYGFTVGYWRDPLMGAYVAVKLPLLIALTLACNGLLNGMLGLLLGTGLGFRQSLLALLTSFALAAVMLGSLAPVTLLLAHNAPPPDAANAENAHAAYLVTPLPENLDLKTLFEALLRRPDALVTRLAAPNHRATARFALMALISIMLFGIVLGCFAKHEQLWAAPAKIAAGLLFSGLICFPSLYIFATLAGAKIAISQLTACLAGALALAGLLLLGFAPAIWIFAESTDSLGFMGTLAIGSWVVAVFFALRFLKAVICASGGTQKCPWFIWSGIFLLVTLQMTTSLRPILGRSNHLLNQDKKFFLHHWGETFGTSINNQSITPPTKELNKRSNIN